MSYQIIIALSLLVIAFIVKMPIGIGMLHQRDIVPAVQRYGHEHRGGNFLGQDVQQLYPHSGPAVHLRR